MIRLGRVLLVDGSAVFRELFASVLQPHADEVAVVRDCESAVARLEERALPDVLLCETCLPDGDGFEVLEHVQAPHATAPMTVLLTSAWSSRIAERARGMGATGVLAKPLGFRDLAAMWKQHRAGADWKDVHRTHTRPLGAAFVLDPQDEDRPLLCWPIVNLGSADALVEAGGPVAVGTRLRLQLNVGELRCRTAAEVARVQDPGWDHSAGIALRFAAPSPELRALVEAAG